MDKFIRLLPTVYHLNYTGVTALHVGSTHLRTRAYTRYRGNPINKLRQITAAAIDLSGIIPKDVQLHFGTEANPVWDRRQTYKLHFAHGFNTYSGPDEWFLPALGGHNLALEVHPWKRKPRKFASHYAFVATKPHHHFWEDVTTNTLNKLDV